MTLVMVGLSWPLWLDGDDFPRIPFVPGWAGLPLPASWAVLGLLMVAIGAGAVGRAWRPMMAASLALLAFEFAGDQDRLQPWAYQYALLGLAAVAFPGPVALRLARLYAISLYLYSGLSKLDAPFLGGLGPTFLAAGLAPSGIDPAGWTPAARAAAILAMPLGEVAVGAGLAFEPTRRPALVAAVGLHSALLMILGPWNLGHSPNVLAWNGAMIAEDLVLFGGGPARPARLGPAPRLLALFFFAYPLGERLGLADSWPSHALYASHSERVEVSLHEADLGRFPASIRRWVAGAGEGPWRRLDLTGWSRAARGVPLYPQARVGVGVAEWLADRHGGPRSVRAIAWGRAGIGGGPRERAECLGLRAIRRRGDRFAINAHPAP